MKGKEIKKTRSWIKEYIRELHLSATFVRDLFGPASTKEASKFLTVVYKVSPRNTLPDVKITVVVEKICYSRKYQPYKA